MFLDAELGSRRGGFFVPKRVICEGQKGYFSYLDLPYDRKPFDVFAIRLKATDISLIWATYETCRFLH